MLNKIKNRFSKAWIPIYSIPVIIGVLMAFFDNIGRRMFLQVSNNAEVYQAMETLYMQLFHGFVFSLIIFTTLTVYYYRKNIRDTLAYLVFSFAVIYSGLWDVLYYVFQGKPVPETLAHLNDTPVSTMAQIFNNGVVSSEMLYLNTFVFLTLGLVVAGRIRYGKLADSVFEFFD